MIGETLGPYKILEPLGAGGMGEVYLGEDTRLGRKVAIKVLPAEFASEPERLARFEQEARAAAALNHPHIAVVHDVGLEEDADGTTTHFMVQEYLEGQSLRQRLDQGALPLDKALGLAIEIDEALVAAHKAGIVHRDLKPDDIFVTEEGHAKVLDFGLAKLTEVVGPAGAEIYMSPTVLGTVAGQMMGTAGYMSREQVEGDGEIDGRADIFAFGCLLYEMTVGKRAFGGKSVLDTLHAIARTDPQPVAEIRPDTPAEIGRILDKCLAKEREQRYQHAEDLLVDLRGLAGRVKAGTAPSFAEASVPGAVAAPARRLAPLLAAAFVAGAALAALGAAAFLATPAADNGVARYEINISESSLDRGYGPAVILSPDGETLAFATQDGLWVRRLDSLEPRQIVELGVDNPVFSPDGQWLAYEQRSTLWRVPVAGGSPLPLTEAFADRGAHWGEAESILLSPLSIGPIVRVAIEGGGEPEPVTELQGDETTHRWPQLLPGGRALLYTAHTRGGAFDGANIVVRDLATGEQHVVLRGGFHGRYVPTGHLVYANSNSLFAVPFDIDELTTTGSSVPVLDNLFTRASNGSAQFHFSDDGTLVYVPLLAEPTNAQLSWAFVGRDGSTGQTWMPNGFSYHPALSPDGGRLVATVITDDGLQNLWSWDRERAATTRITSSEAISVFALWLPDGRELVYAEDSDGTYQLYRTRADGSGGAEQLPDPYESHEFPLSISADGRWLLTGRGEPPGGNALVVRDLTGDEPPQTVLETDNTLHQAALSPDAAWIAYASEESGVWEVYAIPFLAEDGDKVAVSVGGGGMPHWAEDGRSIYYRSPEGVMVVDMESADGRLRPGVPELVFEGEFYGGLLGYPFGNSGLANFEAAGDSQTFVLQQAPGGVTGQTRAIIIFNWFDELERLAPTGR